MPVLAAGAAALFSEHGCGRWGAAATAAAGGVATGAFSQDASEIFGETPDVLEWMDRSDSGARSRSAAARHDDRRDKGRILRGLAKLIDEKNAIMEATVCESLLDGAARSRFRRGAQLLKRLQQWESRQSQDFDFGGSKDRSAVFLWMGKRTRVKCPVYGSCFVAVLPISSFDIHCALCVGGELLQFPDLQELVLKTGKRPRRTRTEEQKKAAEQKWLAAMAAQTQLAGEQGAKEAGAAIEATKACGFSSSPVSSLPASPFETQSPTISGRIAQFTA
ncbi:unnamed protein product [Effrenium voratum]|uniref:Uncharacterized protein n=1 Tax=Effrenium voratum TaxID=2562239 RepID=A0AA36MU87_9DINO|nr:unnamed protein product [Effrenium voratum]